MPEDRADGAISATVTHGWDALGKHYGLLTVVLLVCALLYSRPVSAQTFPSSFVNTTVGGYWPELAGFTFDDLGTMYAWERAGRVWILENDVKLPTPLLDIREEVGAWDDHGLLSVALHPNFRDNGYIYLLYVVDHHHLAKFGTPAYNPAANEYNRATIGRLTRYTARASDGFHSVDPASRTILLGESAGTGCVILNFTHGVGPWSSARTARSWRRAATARASVTPAAIPPPTT